MALIRWEPVREVQSLQQEVNRLFGSFFEMPVMAGSGRGRARSWIPAVDLVEQEDGYVLRADLPGVAEEDVKVELQENLLRISGERRSEHTEAGDGYRRIERAHGTFSRSLALPEGIEAGQIQADFDNGVLEVRIPRPQQRKPQRVAIGLGNRPSVVQSEAPQPLAKETPAAAPAEPVAA